MAFTERDQAAHRGAPEIAGLDAGPEGGLPAGEAADFGFRQVPADQKKQLVGQVFDSVASRYDLMNDLMSGGIHRAWKATLVDWVAPRPGSVLLDVAGGTGDVAFAMARRAPGARIMVCDINCSMVERGRDRALDRGMVGEITWVCGDAEQLPVAHLAVDRCTIAFGLRNVTRIDAALAEMYRVLRPGGRFFCLEFSRVVLPVLDRLYDLYSFSMLPMLGQIVAGDRESYRYLVESIRRFPPQEELSRRMRAAGFERVSHRNLSGGIAAIHTGWRL